VAYSLQLPKSLDNVLQENLHKIDPATFTPPAPGRRGFTLLDRNFSRISLNK
jgi:hypothetical protein